MKQKINICIFLFLAIAVQAQEFPDTFIVLRETVYLQNRGLTEIMGLYTSAKQDIENSVTGEELYLLLARCEYLIGLAFRTEGRNREAAYYFEQGIARAEESIALRPTSEGYRLLGTSIAFLCEIKRSYGIGNFGKIEENARKALELNPNNLVARYLIAARYVAAPWPLTNVRKGLALLEEIIQENYLSMEKEDRFNLYLMLEAACFKQRRHEEARIWRESGAELYPTNNFIKHLLQ